MWYILPDSNKQYPLSISSVLQIKEQNQKGIIPETMDTVEITPVKKVEAEPGFVDVVGQISLRSLEKSDKKRKQQQQQQKQIDKKQKNASPQDAAPVARKNTPQQHGGQPNAPRKFEPRQGAVQQQGNAAKPTAPPPVVYPSGSGNAKRDKHKRHHNKTPNQPNQPKGPAI